MRISQNPCKIQYRVQVPISPLVFVADASENSSLAVDIRLVLNADITSRKRLVQSVLFVKRLMTAVWCAPTRRGLELAQGVGKLVTDISLSWSMEFGTLNIDT